MREYSILVIITCLCWNCTDNQNVNTLQEQIHQKTEEEFIIKKDFYQITVDNLRLRSEPNLSSPILLTLRKGTFLNPTNNKSENTDIIKIGSKEEAKHWHFVQTTNDKIAGWVYGGGIELKNTEIKTVNKNINDCEGIEVKVGRTHLEKILVRANLADKYQLNCNKAPYFIEGDFNGDNQQDIAIRVIEMESKDEDAKEGIIIDTKNHPTGKPTIFGAGIKAFNSDDFDWADIFEKVEKGYTIVSNWNEEAQDFYYENDTIPESAGVDLVTDAIFVHTAESCGGGFIYWKNNKYNWLHFE